MERFVTVPMRPPFTRRCKKKDSLSVKDIVTLSRAGVSEDTIIQYIHDQSTVYTLSTSDVSNLRQAGASQNLIRYMQRTARIYRPTRYPPVGVTGNDDWYWYGPDSPVPNGYPHRR